MLPSNKIFLLFPLPFLLPFLFPVSLNPDSLIDFTRISTASLFFSLSDVILTGASDCQLPAVGATGTEMSLHVVQEPEGGGCWGCRGRCCQANAAELGWLPEAVAQKSKTRRTPRERHLEAGTLDAGWSPAVQSVVHKLAASASPTERSSGPTSNLMNRNL